MAKVLALVGMGPGVSAAVARRFGREGYTIAALARRADALRSEVARLASAGTTAHAYVADAADAAGLEAALGRIAAELGAPEVLVYNAYAAREQPLAQLDAETLVAEFRVNVVGALVAAQAVLPAMRKAGSGTILVTGGGFALEPIAPLASLGVGKAGLRNLTASLHGELKDAGIHVATVTICGYVKPATPFDPDRIAEVYWRLHCQGAGQFEREVVFRGS